MNTSTSQSDNVPLPKRILVMDDELCMRMALECVLESWGCEVSIAVSGQEAIDCYSRAKAAGKPFDAMILDLMVPGGLGGVEALREINKIDRTVHAIAVSGNGNHPALVDPGSFGFKGGLEKPFDADALRPLLALAVSGMTQQRQHGPESAAPR